MRASASIPLPTLQDVAPSLLALTAILVVGCLPYVLMLARPVLFRKWRELVLLASRCTVGLMSLVSV